jgi:hypothetical protein
VKDLILPILKSKVSWVCRFHTGFALVLAHSGSCLAGGGCEQITAAHFLGISHPREPSLPSVDEGGGWHFLWYDPWRMNLLNALLGSIAVIGIATVQNFISIGASREGYSSHLSQWSLLILTFGSKAMEHHLRTHSVLSLGSFYLLAGIVLEENHKQLSLPAHGIGTGNRFLLFLLF